MDELKKEFEKRFIDPGMNQEQLAGAESVWNWLSEKITEINTAHENQLERVNYHYHEKE